MPLPAQPRGCKGRSPLHKKTKKSPPSPEGKGAGGMGEKEKGQGGGGERQSRQAPQRIPERQSHPATTRASSPQGATVARSASAARVQSRGCKGRSPLHKKTQKSPPSPEGKSALRARAGGWGKKRKVKAGAAGGKAGKLPSGFRKGIVIRRLPGQVPRRVPQWQGQPMPPGLSPLHKKTKKPPPSSEGKGAGGLSFPFGEGGKKL